MTFPLLFYVHSSGFSLRSKTASLSLSPEVCWAWRAELAMAVHHVCKGPWTEEEPVLGPECCLCENCTCCRWVLPVHAAWPCWPPALCVSAPASVAPGSLAGHGRWSWTLPGIHFSILGRQTNEGSPWVAATPLLALRSYAMSPGALGSWEVA